MTKRTVMVELTFDDVEHIGLELPQRDGFTWEWWVQLWEPMLELRGEA